MDETLLPFVFVVGASPAGVATRNSHVCFSSLPHPWQDFLSGAAPEPLRWFDTNETYLTLLCMDVSSTIG
jgi:hypothetical protein